VEEATDVAKSLGETAGWSSVPWEDLLKTVIEI
jgi:hypothetical protein